VYSVRCILFDGEGFGLGLLDVIDLFRPNSTPSSVRPFRVGDLLEAMHKASEKPTD
jgi:hypothetical protein